MLIFPISRAQDAQYKPWCSASTIRMLGAFAVPVMPVFSLLAS